MTGPAISSSASTLRIPVGRRPVWTRVAALALVALTGFAAIGVRVGVAETATSPIAGAATAGRAASRSAPPPERLPGCLPEGRSAVADKQAQRFWLCVDGISITPRLPMTTGGIAYALPPVGTYRVYSKSRYARGIHGELLHHFTRFYRTVRGNNIGFHRVVNQDPATLGDLAMRGASAGCFRVTADAAVMVWNHLDIGDAVVVITP